MMIAAEALAALGALSQETRLEAFRLLIRNAPDGLPAGEVSRALGVPANTLSTHLAILTRGGLVEASREGRVIRYRANVAGLKALMLFLATDCCAGNPDHCGVLVDELVCC